MKYEILSNQNGAVRGKAVIKLKTTPEETTKLRQALAVVDRYKKAAMRAANSTKADWTMVGYAVKTDGVVVTVEQGSCG